MVKVAALGPRGNFVSMKNCAFGIVREIQMKNLIALAILNFCYLMHLLKKLIFIFVYLKGHENH